jgi:flavin reductase (DIM6/NTAB) family NADH-FMN oxidoreductase RutF
MVAQRPPPQDRSPLPYARVDGTATTGVRVSGTDGLGTFVSGLDYPMFVVTVATGTQPAERSGCLVGFATQCSISPARMLVCLSKNNHTYLLARAASALAVHRLAAGQRDLASLFGEATGDEVDKFARCAWRTGPAGQPVLTDSATWLVGTVLDRMDLGDHVGFLLAPIEVGGSPDGRPLQFSDVRDLDAGHPA